MSIPRFFTQDKALIAFQAGGLKKRSNAVLRKKAKVIWSNGLYA